jgi:hypothetical protein
MTNPVGKASAKDVAKKEWLKGEGQLSGVLGDNLWESLCWQRGSLQHIYISSRFNALDADATDPPHPQDLVDRAVKNLHHMLRVWCSLASF